MYIKIAKSSAIAYQVVDITSQASHISHLTSCFTNQAINFTRRANCVTR